MKLNTFTATSSPDLCTNTQHHKGRQKTTHAQPQPPPVTHPGGSFEPSTWAEENICHVSIDDDVHEVLSGKTTTTCQIVLVITTTTTTVSSAVVAVPCCGLCTHWPWPPDRGHPAGTTGSLSCWLSPRTYWTHTHRGTDRYEKSQQQQQANS